MDKREALAALEREMRENISLPLQTNLVFGEGNLDCEALFIGEAPGLNEDIQKRPFVGRGGQLLRECIRGLGWRENEVYITNIVKRRPPENRDPLPDELAAYTPYLTRQIAIISPKVIVPLGRFSMNYFLPEAKITRDQGKPFQVDGRLVVPMFHPAAALRATGVMEEFRKGFKLLPEIIAGAVPATAVSVAPPAQTKVLQKGLF
ncbi:MAG: uracil-DNA glycosylase [Candidatus Liptonbacteria bacterium]|nr:uracil-DNA glycosylase [Candidatus Liptonbacteria bacterium]